MPTKTPLNDDDIGSIYRAIYALSPTKRLRLLEAVELREESAVAAKPKHKPATKSAAKKPAVTATA